MFRALFATYIVVVCCVVAACPSSPPSVPPPPSLPAGEGEGEGEGESIFSIACDTDDECPSGRCSQFYGPGQLATDTCTVDCLSNDDCVGLGSEAVCVQQVCMPRCEVNSDCDATSNDGVCVAFDGETVCIKTIGQRCEAQGECGEGETCAQLRGTDLAHYCLPTEDVGLPMGASCTMTDHHYDGLTCASPEDCPGDSNFCGSATGSLANASCQTPVENFCANGCINNTCAGPCRDDNDCDGTDRCVDIVGSGFAFKRCAPGAGSLAPCDREADCSNGEHCSTATDDAGLTVTRCILRDSSFPAVGGVCGDNLGTIDVLEEPLVPCATGYCSDGRCQLICSSDDDCVQGESCLRLPFADPAVDIGACTASARCDSNFDCDADTEVCIDLRYRDGVQRVCRTQLPTTKDGGEPCDVGAEAELGIERGICFGDDDCRDGEVCHMRRRRCFALETVCEAGCNPDDQRCFSSCANDADCVDHGVNARCEGHEANLGTETDPFVVLRRSCVEREGSLLPCGADVDCAATNNAETCAAVTDVDGVVSTVCERSDRVPNGGPCDVEQDVVCASNLCIDNTCQTVCDVDVDCVSGRCVEAPVEFGGPGISICAP